MSRAFLEIVTCKPMDRRTVCEAAECLREAGLSADFDGCRDGGCVARFVIAEARDAEAVWREIEGCLCEIGVDWERVSIRTEAGSLFVESPSGERRP